jgi:hypothetical protein
LQSYLKQHVFFPADSASMSSWYSLPHQGLQSQLPALMILLFKIVNYFGLFIPQMNCLPPLLQASVVPSSSLRLTPSFF